MIQTWIKAAIAFTLLDLLFLGVLARDFFDRNLGPLKANPINIPAAVLFYVMYLTFITFFACESASSRGDAALRGAALGFFAYATYELTNWAVIQDWPGKLVPVDILWGTILTCLVCAFAYTAKHG